MGEAKEWQVLSRSIALVVGGGDPGVDVGGPVDAGDANEEREVFGEPRALRMVDVVEPFLCRRTMAAPARTGGLSGP